MKYTKKCETCGHISAAFTYKLNVGKVKALRRLVDAYEANPTPKKLGELGLTNSQYTNFCHLAYWDLARKIKEGWIPTQEGIDFIYGKRMIVMPVAVMNGNILPEGHEAWKTHDKGRQSFSIKDIDETAYKQKEEYAAEKQHTLL